MPSSSTGAYCDARQRLPSSLVTALSARVAHAARHRCGALEDPTPALLIDGTGVSMPDTPENQALYPQSASQADGCGFPQARMTALVCAVSGAVVDSVTGAAKGKGTGETAALRSMSRDVAPGTVLIGDAIYEDYPTWATLARANLFGVFELNGSRCLGSWRQKRIVLERPTRRPSWMSPEEHAAQPARIRLRVVRSTRPGCSDKILITSLLDVRAWPAHKIRALYDRRWDVELDFRSFKDTLGAGVLACCTPEMVIKELAVHLLGLQPDPAADVRGGRGCRDRAAPGELSPRPAAVGQLGVAGRTAGRGRLAAAAVAHRPASGAKPARETRAASDQATAEAEIVAEPASALGANDLPPLREKGALTRPILIRVPLGSESVGLPIRPADS